MSALPLLPALAGAKRRALRRRDSSGGTMFVVAMTLAVLSTVGAWALQSAALEVRMAGFERQSSQTHYLSEYGLLATTEDVAANALGPKVAQWAVCGANVTAGSVSTNYHAQCLSLPCINAPSGGGPATVSLTGSCAELTGAGLWAKSCYRWQGWSSFAGGFSTPATLPLMDVEDGGVSGTPGSLGATNMQGTFSAEFTDLTLGPPLSGNSIGGSGGTNQSANSNYFATITAYGQTSATGGSSQSQGNELLRARIVIGPIPTLNTAGCQ
jgi:hypothetical protein